MKDRVVPVTIAGWIVLAVVLSTTSAKEPSSPRSCMNLRRVAAVDAAV